ncbi:MAG: acylneuraminate cytidylyltransferase [Candidatus Omnitrophica bacterium]|nr:acylneuraminate cytidylyltransferase [Candidatus Omnitrophota bacterium]
MKITALIQARMGSSRLPGKVMEDIEGKAMLARVIERVQKAAGLSAVAVVTSVTEQDQAIENFCLRVGVPCFRGSENNVLDRYYRAASYFKAEAVMRITSDCPLIDPVVIDELIWMFKEAKADYGSNFFERRFPRGLDAEVMTFAALEKVWMQAKEPYQQTHVTPYFYQNPSLFNIASLRCPMDQSAKRWTVDTLDDLCFVRAVYHILRPRDFFNWREILDVLKHNPGLEILNSNVPQKKLHES